MNSRNRATNITSYIHVCTIAITMQMVVNFLKNNVRAKNLRAQLDVFYIIGPGGPKFSANFGPGPNISGPVTGPYNWISLYSIIYTL